MGQKQCGVGSAEKGAGQRNGLTVPTNTCLFASPAAVEQKFIKATLHLRLFYVLGTVLSSFHALSHLFFTSVLWERGCFSSSFYSEGDQTQRG